MSLDGPLGELAGVVADLSGESTSLRGIRGNPWGRGDEEEAYALALELGAPGAGDLEVVLVNGLDEEESGLATLRLEGVDLGANDEVLALVELELAVEVADGGRLVVLLGEGMGLVEGVGVALAVVLEDLSKVRKKKKGGEDEEE